MDDDSQELRHIRDNLADSSVHLVTMKYRLLEELAANARRVLTYERLLERVWDRKGGDDATYVFTEPRMGYWVPAGEGPA